MNDQDKIILFRTYATLPEAWTARNILEQNGISCFLANECFAQLYPLYGTSAVGGVQLHLFEKDAAKAKDVLDSLLTK